MEKCYGNHLGLVINDRDPEQRGRVQIFIPHISNTLFVDWNDIVTKNQDIEFKHIGEGGGLSPAIIKRLIMVLPWAEGAAPIWGGGTASYYKPSSRKASTNPMEVVVDDHIQSPLLDGEEFTNANKNLLNFIRSIGYSESGYSDAEANSDKLNQSSNNANVRKSGPNGADYGYYQCNQLDVWEAVKLGMDPELAGALNGGGKGGTPVLYDINMQTKAMMQYLPLLAVKNPAFEEGYKHILAGEFEAAVGSLPKKWFGPTDAFNREPQIMKQIWAGGGPRSDLSPNAVASATDASGGSQQTIDPSSGQSTNTGQTEPFIAESQLSPLPEIPSDTPSLSVTNTDPKFVRDTNFGSSGIVSVPTGSSGTGMVSIPKPGAKVWVFFNGGDIQCPVYFAQQSDPASFKSVQNIASPDNTNADTENQIAQNNTIATKQGGLKQSLQLISRPDISAIPEDRGHVTLYDKNGNRESFTADGRIVNVAGSSTEKVSGSVFETVRGNKETFINGTHNNIGLGDHFHHIGKQGTMELSAANLLQNTLNDIHQTKIAYISNNATKGHTTCCPVCNANYLDQNNSCISSILGFIRRIIPPYFSFALDVLDFISIAAEVILPSVRSAYDLNGGTCGNPLCKNGKIPEPSQAIERANKEAIQRIQDQQDHIQQLESNLGAGGVHAFQTSKDLFFGAGLGDINSANPYAKIGRNSNSYHLAPADKTPTVLINKADGYERMMHNDVPMIPGGNQVFQANNKLTFIAGTPGIEFITGGKTKIQAGDLEITAAHSDLILAAAGTAILKGKGVHVEIDDTDGTGGFLVTAKRTRIGGSLSVDADAAIKGGLTIDGELSVPFLTVPSMRTKTTMASGPDRLTNAAQWSADAISAYARNLAANQLTHYAEAGYLATISGATHLALATYTQSMLATVLEIMPTGICITDAGVGTVYNYVHTHGLSPQDHTHEATIPKGSYTNNLGSWAQERGQNNIIPTPARSHGDSSTPGPRSHGSCGLCGLDGGAIQNTFSTTEGNTNDGNTDNTGKPILTPAVGSNC